MTRQKSALFTDEQVCMLRKEYEQGIEKTISMIAKEFNTSVTVVKDMLYGRTYKDAGYTMDNKKAIENNKHKLGSKRRDIDLEKIKELHSKGWCNHHIAKEMGIHRSTLINTLSKLGLTANKNDIPTKSRTTTPRDKPKVASKPKVSTPKVTPKPKQNEEVIARTPQIKRVISKPKASNSNEQNINPKIKENVVKLHKSNPITFSVYFLSRYCKLHDNEVKKILGYK